MIELGVVGARNSGKTTVVEGLVSHLTDRGLRVATVKHTSHSHGFDTPGKDSHRHRQAGAGLTVAVSDEEVAVFAEPGLLDASQIHHLTSQPIDIWLIEGDRRTNRPKVLVTRRLTELSGRLPTNIIATIGPERIDDVSVHFEADDYGGLASFVNSTMVNRKAETRK